MVFLAELVADGQQDDRGTKKGGLEAALARYRLF